MQCSWYGSSWRERGRAVARASGYLLTSLVAVSENRQRPLIAVQASLSAAGAVSRGTYPIPSCVVIRRIRCDHGIVLHELCIESIHTMRPSHGHGAWSLSRFLNFSATSVGSVAVRYSLTWPYPRGVAAPIAQPLHTVGRVCGQVSGCGHQRQSAGPYPFRPTCPGAGRMTAGHMG